MNDPRWGRLPDRQSEKVCSARTLPPNLPDSAAPEVRALVEQCYATNPLVRLQSIMGLSVMVLKEAQSHMEGKVRVAGNLLKAMSWREAERNG